jgi:hypothetical protein
MPPTAQSGVLDRVDHPTPALVSWIAAVVSMKKPALVFLQNWPLAGDHPDFASVVRDTILREDESIRKAICDVITAIPSLFHTFHGCEQLFQLLKGIASDLGEVCGKPLRTCPDA